MPVKRRLAKVRENRITPEAVAAFNAEDRTALADALRLRPWEISPLEVCDGPSPYPAGSGGCTTWQKALELLTQLQKAAMV